MLFEHWFTTARFSTHLQSQTEHVLVLGSRQQIHQVYISFFEDTGTGGIAWRSQKYLVTSFVKEFAHIALDKQGGIDSFHVHARLGWVETVPILLEYHFINKNDSSGQHIAAIL